jgi:hypothetical protein
MIRYSKIQNKPRIFRSLTGLTRPAFLELLETFTYAYEQALKKEEEKRKKARQRQRGAGRKATLSNMADKLLFILFYFRVYPTQEALGFFFGFGQPQANEWIHRLTPVLNAALGYEKQLPARNSADVERVLAECPELEFIIDGTERPIQRPKDRKLQKEYYSGKKKRHTVKNIVITEKRTGKIKALSETSKGKKHDKTLADDQQYRFPDNSSIWKDTGFQGYEPKNTSTYQPKKKPRGGELTQEEKDQNRTISRQRIFVEHSIGGVKIWRIVHDIFRNHKPNYEDLAMQTACGLHNLKIDYRAAA